MNEEMSAEEYEQRGLWTKLKERMGISELEEEYEEDAGLPGDARKKPVTLRLHSASVSHVSLKLPQTFEDARVAADGLKEGRLQIVNLEKTSQEMSERIIDFLNGVTYALNGVVEKVGDRVYLFTPSNVVIEVPEDLRKVTPELFESGV